MSCIRESRPSSDSIFLPLLLLSVHSPHHRSTGWGCPVGTPGDWQPDLLHYLGRSGPNIWQSSTFPQHVCLVSNCLRSVLEAIEGDKYVRSEGGLQLFGQYPEFLTASTGFRPLIVVISDFICELVIIFYVPTPATKPTQNKHRGVFPICLPSAGSA